MGVQLNSSKFKSNDLTRMMPVTSEPFKTLQNRPKSKQPPDVPYCGIVHALRFGWPRTVFDRLSQPIPASEAIIAKRTATNHAESMPSAYRRVPSAERMARRRTGACRLLSRRTKSGVSSLVLSSLPPCHTYDLMAYRHTHDPL